MPFCLSLLFPTHLARCKLGISPTRGKDKHLAPKSTGGESSNFLLAPNNGKCMKQGSKITFLDAFKPLLGKPFWAHLHWAHGDILLMRATPASPPAAPLALRCPLLHGFWAVPQEGGTWMSWIPAQAAGYLQKYLHPALWRAAAWGLLVQWYRSICAIQELISFRKTT